MNEKEIRLDLNESPYDIMKMLKNDIEEELEKSILNRYPDKSCLKLRKCISEYVGMNADKIAVGNGSDELIMMIFQAFLKKGDKLQIQKPTFSMYKHYAMLMGAEVLEYDLGRSFHMDVAKFKELMKNEQPDVLIICNPNNPTGELLDATQIEAIAQDFDGIIVVDEAYYEFGDKSALELLDKYKNIIILRTFSKAFGLAGLRVGYMLGSEDIINRINSIRSPFNVNAYSQTAASAVMKNRERVKVTIDLIKVERKKLYERLMKLKNIEVFDSKANFILIRSPKSSDIYIALMDRGIVVRSFGDDALRDCLRITIGTEYENNELLKALEVICSE